MHHQQVLEDTGCASVMNMSSPNSERDGRVFGMNEYVPTIGLEIHAELKTRTKMFCNCRNNPDEETPNVNVCPVCMAHPGALPVINKEAVRHVLRVGEAISGTRADYTEFDRKNYFYPDLPKGYQVSQYEYPLISGGTLCDVRITRIHLEEDTASSAHDDQTGETLVNYNRGGVPLMELVTEPDIHSASKAGEFARELQRLLRTLGASEANMEKGEMRVEANISVARGDARGTKVEIKNLNSFRTMERAVAHEIQRQVAALERGEKIIQETRGWDENKQATFPQRVKEGSADYRYFPDPDLPPLRLSEIKDFAADDMRAELPELPSERRARYTTLGLKPEDAEMFIADARLGSFFDSVICDIPNGDPRVILAANYIANDLAKEIRDLDMPDAQHSHEIDISPADFATIITMAANGDVSSRGAKNILKLMFTDNRDPRAIAESEGLLLTVSKDDLKNIIANVCADNQKVVSDVLSGKDVALQYLVGQTMKATKGSGDPQKIRDIIKDTILG